ncbi:hypothetical protein AAG747_18085 [Rapidithrix thailandica]|uniref:Helix-hairpin-helix motif-containing protein n=1 Tax=Rapidithrix thailandica TaxID=413964 RepID=A0AAW9SBI1_9BACT
MLNKLCLIVVLWVFFYPNSWGQSTQNPFEQILEELSVSQEEGAYQELYDFYERYYRQPIDLNRTDRNELESLHLLSVEQLNQFFLHRQRLGPLLSIYELQVIESFDLPTIRKLLPFVQVPHASLEKDNRSLFFRMKEAKNHFLLMRWGRVLETQKGFKEDSLGQTKYQGSPGRLYLRYRLSRPRDFSFGLSLEKDAGEPLWRWGGSQKTYGMDFMSFHISLMNKGNLKNLTLGDYKLQIGQGLLLSGGFSLGKSSESTIGTKRSTLLALPYTSKVETGYFRGVAGTYQWGQCSLTGFVSGKRMDASLEQDSLERQMIVSFPVTGYHRTESEWEKKNASREMVLGHHARYANSTNSFSVGLTSVWTRYRHSVNKPDRIYTQWDFEGRSNWVVGVDWQYQWHNLSFFGEGGRSVSGGLAWLSGILASLSKQVEVSLLYRNYDRDFHSFYGNAFGENSQNKNERGIYLGWKIIWSRKWQLAGYVDQFTFPWLKYQVDAPSSGYEVFSRLTHSPKRHSKIYFQYRYEKKEKNLTGSSSKASGVSPVVKQNYLVNAEHKVSDFFSLRTRLQGTFYRQEALHHGLAMMQDVYFTYRKFRLSLRFAAFQTPHYETRQYAYERDVLYSFYIPVYYGEGSRHYALLKYKLSRSISLDLKYAVTLQTTAQSTGSGWDEIAGPRKSEIKCQIRVKL